MMVNEFSHERTNDGKRIFLPVHKSINIERVHILLSMLSMFSWSLPWQVASLFLIWKLHCILYNNLHGLIIC